MTASKQGREIHRRLQRDEPVQHIADEMGLSRSQVHRHKRGACSCAGKPPAPATLQTRLIKTGGRLVRHARRLVFQLAEVLVSREMLTGILERISRLRLAPG